MKLSQVQFKEQAKQILKQLSLGGKGQLVGSFSRDENFSDIDSNVLLKPTHQNLLKIAELFSNKNLPVGLRFVSFKTGTRNRALHQELKKLQKQDQWSKREVDLAQQLPYESNMLSTYLWLVSTQPDILFEDGIKLDFDYVTPVEMPDKSYSIPFTVVYQFKKSTPKEILRALYKDFQTKVNQGNYWKAMKRLHSISIIKNDRRMLQQTKNLVMQGKNSITEKLAKNLILNGV